MASAAPATPVPAAPASSAALSGALLVEVPAPRWQLGAFGAGLAIADAISAQSFLLAGAVPTADPTGASDVRRVEGLQSFFQRWHELWIGDGGDALSIQGIDAERSYDRDVVISFGREIIRPEQVPAFAGPLLETFRDLALRTSIFDGTRELVPFSGATDMAMSYAKRFAEGRFAIVFLGSAVRRFFELRRFAEPGAGETRLEARLRRLGAVPAPLDVAARAIELASCAAREAKPDDACPTRRATAASCALAAVLEGFRRYSAERNPYDLRAQLDKHRAGSRSAAGCHVELARDAASGRPWVLAARAGEAQLLPMDGALIPLPGAAVPGVPRLRRAVTLGTSALKVEAAPDAAPKEVTP